MFSTTDHTSADLSETNQAMNKSKKSSSSSSSSTSSSSSSSSKELYCICRSADAQQFMIACDNCDEWYHGECVGISQSLSKKIKTFFCHLCRMKNPKLRIRYKRKFHKLNKVLGKCSSEKKEAILARKEIYAKFYKENRAREKKESHLIHQYKKERHRTKKQAKIEETDTKPTVPAIASSSMTSFDALLSTTECILNMENNESRQDDKTASSMKNQHYGKSNVSGEDIQDFFFALAKLGSDVAPMNTNSPQVTATVPLVSEQDNSIAVKDASKQQEKSVKSKSKTKKRHRHDHDGDNVNDVDHDQHPSRHQHGDKRRLAKLKKRRRRSVSSSENTGARTRGGEETKIATNSCSGGSSSSSSCNSSDSESASSSNSESESGESDGNDSLSYCEHQTVKSYYSSDEDENNSNDHNDGGDHTLLNENEHGTSKSSVKQSNRQQAKTKKDNAQKKPIKKGPVATKQSSLTKLDDVKNSKLKRTYNMTNSRKLAANNGQKKKNLANMKLKQQAVKSKQEPLKVEEQPAQQCLGPECVNVALDGSKYCSMSCGLNLAKKRLNTLLEPNLNAMKQVESYADAHNMRQLEIIDKEIADLKSQLNDLEMRHEELDKLIERSKSAKIDPNVEREYEKNLESNEVEIYCVTCGYSCSERHALKHMDKCFNKIESQAFFGSFYKTRIDGQSMFCDYYNAQTKMYCKRLRVMCPEHQKEKKISDTEVCGCKLSKYENIHKANNKDTSQDTGLSKTSDSDSDICLAPKRSCPLHYKWEKLKRAQIDLEKLRTWLQLEELLEKKRAHEQALNERGGLLSMLLHKTTYTSQTTETSQVGSTQKLI